MRVRPVLVSVAILLLVACGEDDLKLPPAPPEVGGQVIGRIRVGGQGARVRLEFRGIGVPGGRQVNAYTEEDGSFSVPLPDGDYRLYLRSEFQEIYYGPHGPTTNDQEAETLRVAAGMPDVRADLDLGAIDLRLRWPDWWMDRFALVRVWDVPDSASADLHEVGAEYFHDDPDSLTARLGPLLPGAYFLSITSPEIGSGLWLPGTYHREEAETVRVGIDAPASVDRSLDVRRRMIRGSITGAWQSLLPARPTVRACIGEETILNATDCLPDGRFDLAVISEPQVRIRLEFGGTTRWLGGDTYEHATPIDLPDTGAVVLPPILDRGILLSPGTARLRGSGRVDYRVEHRSSTFVVIDDFEFDAPTVPICGLVPGDYRLHLKPEYFGQLALLGQWYDRAGSSDDAIWIHIGESDESVPIAITPEAGAVVRGRVTNSGDRRHIELTWRPAEGDTCSEVSYIPIEEDGSYEILGVPDGTYKVAFGEVLFEDIICEDPLPRGWIWYGQVTHRDSATVITIADHGTVEGIDVELPADAFNRPAPALPASARTSE